MVFTPILGFLFLFYSILTFLSLKNKFNRTILNFLMSGCILLSIANRMLSMIHSLVWDNNKIVTITQIAFYFDYQLPFDLLNISVIA